VTRANAELKELRENLARFDEELSAIREDMARMRREYDAEIGAMKRLQEEERVAWASERACASSGSTCASPWSGSG
jgi:Skp family chaperone for outer membrane proteins